MKLAFSCWFSSNIVPNSRNSFREMGITRIHCIHCTGLAINIFSFYYLWHLKLVPSQFTRVEKLPLKFPFFLDNPANYLHLLCNRKRGLLSFLLFGFMKSTSISYQLQQNSFLKIKFYLFRTKILWSNSCLDWSTKSCQRTTISYSNLQYYRLHPQHTLSIQR